ncbi:MAG: heterodisulfide reductase-related iron-sulfur binding cluster [Vicinamibacterales bacterium]
MSAVVSSAFDGQDAPDPALVDACVHCGFCLPTCPTYLIGGEEMDSPRGRIYLMRAAREGRTEISPSFVKHFDSCLGCMSCVTACPSGVQYGPLLEATRGQIERRYPRPISDRWFRRALFALLPYPGRMRIALLPLAVLAPLRRVIDASGVMGRLPTRIRAAFELAPRVSLGALFRGAPERTAATGARRLTAGLLTGCVQRLVQPHVNQATINVLAAEGCDVIAPPAQGCCGALSLHVGRLDDARGHARRTIETFERAAVDVVVVNAAGCGSSMKEYGHLLKDDPAWADRARAFSARVRDIHEVLVEMGPSRTVKHALPVRVAYQDACHLAHAQGVRQAPRDLLRSIPGLTLLEITESEICCGSAGVYNLVQPDTAAVLGERKVGHIAATNPDVIASGNPGCALQIVATARKLGHTWRVVHPVELLDASIRNAQLGAKRTT